MERCLELELPYLIKCKTLKCVGRATDGTALAAKHSPCHCPLAAPSPFKGITRENKYLHCYRMHILQLEMFTLLLFRGTANISGPLINFNGFSDSDSLVNDLRIPLRDKKDA